VQFSPALLSSCFPISFLLVFPSATLKLGGYFLALLFLFQVQVYGIVVFGTQCSMWLNFLSQSVHRRAARWQRGVCGAWEKLNVFRANVMAENVAVLMMTLYTRHVHQVEENPAGSYLFSYDSQTFVRDTLGFEFIHTWMKWFGHLMPKPTKLLGSLVGISSLVRKYSKRIWQQRSAKIRLSLRKHNLSFPRPTANKWHKRRMHKPDSVVTLRKPDDSGMWICGGKDLKSSATYTRRFADAVLSVWESNRFLLSEPVFKLTELLHACPFPMHAKQYRKSAGPGGSLADEPMQEDGPSVDPTSRPSTCQCWYLVGDWRCRPCRRLPAEPSVQHKPSEQLQGTLVPSIPLDLANTSQVVPGSAALCGYHVRSEPVPSDGTFFTTWQHEFGSASFMD
jgi:hypothetical protein